MVREPFKPFHLVRTDFGFDDDTPGPPYLAQLPVGHGGSAVGDRFFPACYRPELEQRLLFLYPNFFFFLSPTRACCTLRPPLLWMLWAFHASRPGLSRNTPLILGCGTQNTPVLFLCTFPSLYLAALICPGFVLLFLCWADASATLPPFRVVYVSRFTQHGHAPPPRAALAPLDGGLFPSQTKSSLIPPHVFSGPC